mmetsp:Transcript_63509/g.186355  ORF Transcript_63509/g.186355 Transcript_63509/m.186355 type:complete len:570 (-) Transcript_63509:46-1755(-)
MSDRTGQPCLGPPPGSWAPHARPAAEPPAATEPTRQAASLLLPFEYRWAVAEREGEDEDAPSLRVLSLNILADGLARGASGPPAGNPPCPKLFLEDGTGGEAKLEASEDGHHFRCSRNMLAWKRRWPMLMSLILQFEPHLVGLQEVDMLEGTAEELEAHDAEIRRDLGSAGFEGTFARKGGRACDGLGVFWRRERLKAAGEPETWTLAASVHVALAQPLLLDGTWPFLAVVTHLKAGLSAEAEEIRERQAGALLERLEVHPDVVLMADLNAHCRPWDFESPPAGAASEASEDTRVPQSQDEPLEWHTGRVKYFSWQQGYGFVECEEAPSWWHGHDVFLHWNQLAQADLQHLNKGDAIRFTVEISDDGKPQARNVESYTDQLWVPPTQRFTGRVKAYSSEKGFGFIECGATQRVFNRDVFLHRNQAQCLNVKQGDMVTFHVKLSSKGQPQARGLAKAAGVEGCLGPVEPKAYPLLRKTLRSACVEVLGDEPSFTCWSGWEDRETRGVFDYVLLRGELFAPSRVVLVPDAEDVLGFAERLPNAVHPSDHFPIVADLVLKTSALRPRCWEMA